ncbi:MAG: dipeptidase [Clostridia bacterium]|nr:dipeptidase [Clostridia bacterium]
MKISDSHTDFLTSIKYSSDRQNYIKQIKEYGAKNISCAVFTTNKGFSIDRISQYLNELDSFGKKYNINLLLSIEDIGFIKSNDEFDKLIALRPISVTLTWNYANQFAGGSYTDLGLSNLGKKYVKLLEENNILVDTAHLSQSSFWDFCKLSKLPIYNSHSNIYNLKHHNRNLTDKQIKQIVKTDGYLGITMYDQFISKNKITSKDLAYQFDYLIKNFGYKNFGLGTDLHGIDYDNLPLDIKGYNDLNNFVKQLKYLGYNKDIIDCILYKNFEDFVNRINCMAN